MTQHLAVGLSIGLFIAAMIAVLVSQKIFIEMTEQVNRKRAPGQKLDLWLRSSSWAVLSEYKSMYPSGNLLRFFFIAGGAVIVCWLGCVVLLFGVLPQWTHYIRR
jgi:hypothetical protein